MSSKAGYMKYVPARRKTTPGKGWWSESKRIEVCTLYVATRSPTAVSLSTGVPFDTIKNWMKTPWWKELVDQIQYEDNEQLDAKTTKIINKTMDLLADRVENGEYIFDQKSGTVKRLPMSARTATKVASDLFDKRQIIRKQPTKIVEQHDIASRINALATEFAKYTNAKQIDAEVVHTDDRTEDAEVVHTDDRTEDAEVVEVIGEDNAATC